MKSVGCSDIGKKRKQNEDSFRFGKFDDSVVWAVVCDGMGGATGGQIASSVAADIISKKIEKCYNKLMNEKSLENLLLSAVTAANVIVFDKSVEDPSLSGMGTTVVACISKDNYVCIAHVGDSRAYLLKQDSIEQITKDHSLVQEMLDNGQITKEEFINHPNKNIITRALGVGEKVEIDFNHLTLEEDDTLLICTDGLSGSVSDEQILKIYQTSAFENLASNYIEAANNNGGPDNITVVALKCENE
ncbi:MAG: Stp1/IreP family PP2C-type Ser/Thr phosphatase [Acutalibacteraceae bacterium]